MLAARRRKKRLEASVRVGGGMPIRLRAQIALQEGWEASAEAMRRVGKGTQTQVRRSAQEAREALQAWALQQVQQAQNAVLASSIADDWRRIRQTQRWRRAAGRALSVFTSLYSRTIECVLVQ